MIPKTVERTEPGAFSALLRREERLEHVPLGRAIHSNPGIAHGEKHVRPRDDLGMLVRIVDIERRIRGRDGELAARRHRIARVDDEVHEHLFDLSGIGAHAPEAGCRQRLELDVLTQNALEHLADAGEYFIEIEDLRRQHLLSAEGEHLAREVRGGQARAMNVLDLRT